MRLLVPYLRRTLPSRFRLGDPFQPLRMDGLVLMLFSTEVIEEDGVAVETWEDLSGKDYHAVQVTPASRPVVAAAQLNGKKVLSFDGVDDHFVVAHTPDHSFSDSYTILAYVKQDALATSRAILDKRDDSTATGYALITSNSDSDRLHVIQGSAFNDGFISNDAAWTENTWRIVALRVNTVSRSAEFFLGPSIATDPTRTLIGSGSISGANAATTFKDLVIGAKAHAGSSVAPWNGDMAAIAVYNRLLTDAELDKAIYVMWRHYFDKGRYPFGVTGTTDRVMADIMIPTGNGRVWWNTRSRIMSTNAVAALNHNIVWNTRNRVKSTQTVVI